MLKSWKIPSRFELIWYLDFSSSYFVAAVGIFILLLGWPWCQSEMIKLSTLCVANRYAANKMSFYIETLLIAQFTMSFNDLYLNKYFSNKSKRLDLTSIASSIHD